MSRTFESIPSPPHLPVIGHTPQYFKNPIDFVLNSYHRYGHMVRYNIAWERCVFLYGPEAAQFVLGDKTKAFSSKFGWQFRMEEFFKNGLMLRDFDDHHFHRGVMQSAFSSKALEGYLGLINQTIEDRLEAWEESENFKFYPAFKQLTLDIAAASFLGVPLGEDAKRVNRAFTDAVAAIPSIIRFPVPGSAWRRGLKGRAFLINFLRRLIPKKRKRESVDLFSKLCVAVNDTKSQKV